MELKTTERKFYEVDYGDFEEFIQEEFGISEYSFACDMECGNDSSHEFNVKAELDQWDEDQIKKFVDSDGKEESYMAHALFNKLCQQGKIKEGNYLVKVSW